MAGASGVVTGMGEGWVVVFSKSELEGQLRSTKLTERDVAGTPFGFGEGGVMVVVVGSSYAGLRWVVKAVGVAMHAYGVLQEGGVVVLRVLGVVEHRNHAKPEIKIRLWKPPCRCPDARNFDDCASKQIYICTYTTV